MSIDSYSEPGSCLYTRLGIRLRNPIIGCRLASLFLLLVPLRPRLQTD